MRVRLSGLAALLATPALADPTPVELQAAALAEARGAQMYAYDQAAWRASDAIQDELAKLPQDELARRMQGAAGYVVEPIEGGVLQTTFYRRRDGAMSAIGRYRTTDAKVTGGLVAPGGTQELSPLALRMIAARDLAVARMTTPNHMMCSAAPPNTLVLPPDGDGSIVVYVMTPATTNGIYPAGGHYRFDVAPDGRVVSERRFMNTCFPIDYRSRQGNTPQWLFVTHLLDPQPTEVHAFVSRYVPVPMLVGTVSSKAIWTVANGDIRYSSSFPAEATRGALKDPR